MILPSKHISEEQSLLGIGGLLLANLEVPQTITSLWEKVRGNHAVGTYERFVLALNLLYIIDVVNLKNGLINRGAI